MDEQRKAALEKWPSLRKAFDSEEDYVESHDGREARLLQYIYAQPNLSELRNSPQKILDAMDRFAGHEDFLINIGDDKGKIVADLIAAKKPKVLVELGGYVGYSAIWFADAMRRANGGSAAGLRLWSLEFDPLIASIAMNLVDLAGLSDVVKIVVGKAEDSLKRLCAEGRLKAIDVFFLDHVEDLYVADFNVAESLGLLKKGATVVADNVVRPGAPEYRKMVRAHPRLQSKGIKGLIMPGGFEDEVEVSEVIKD